ncbi:wall-associated receptor kinase-like 2 [Carya illinoinensis]|uniref:wall-associated receptor kinase-like 2 n=1 Tax=Carya illinoinensis TaxID=32201 RepID=UPI001C71BD46|nr:wall-associated receptor kinase-like 2 [Carya illinoinensis]
MNACLKLKRKDTEETPFMKNGRMLLEERIALFNGKCNPIRFFSAMELSTATNNYDASNFTEKDDVYCFGGILLVLLAGWMLNTNSTTYSEGHLLGWVNAGYEQRLIEIVDPELLKESVDQQQFLTFANLALTCISNKREDGPTITNVGKQLSRIYDQCLTPP